MADLKAQLQIGADVSGVEAGISKAKKSINSLGVAVQDANSRGAKSIDRYVQSLQTQAATMGKSAREAELYKLALRGASDAQLKAADSAIKLKDAYEKGEALGQRLRASMIAFGAIATTGLIAATIAFDQLLKKAGNFQDMAEKFGDTAQNFASLAVAAGTAGVQMDTIGAASAKLTKNLTGVDDESKDAGAAIKALGLSIDDFKNKAPTDQLETVAKALAGFEDGASKTAVAMALFGKSGAELLPFLKELGAEGGRQVILTEQQIALADEYSDKQAKLRTEISLHAQALATELLPTINEFSKTIADVAKDQEFAATASGILKTALSAGIVVFQTIAVVASDVGFVFQGVGREIGAIAAQLVALARLDFAGFRAISDAVRDDAVRARAELDRFQARIMAIGQPQSTTPLDREGLRASELADRARTRVRTPLKFTGATKKDGDKTAEQEAKAQLALDIEQIRKASEAITNVFADSQKIMEAQRAAGLLDEREYYAAKLGFIRLNSEEQQRALQQELARLQQEKLTGKDKLDNERKIADVRAKLSKVQQDASAQQIILDTQEAAAASQRATALLSARQAAQDYYDEIQRQQQRDLASIGQGKRVRDLNSGLNQIEDRYAGQRRDLDNQAAKFRLAQEGRLTDAQQAEYDRRLAIINEFQQKSSDSYIAYYARLMEQQGNWAAGANQALQDYFDDSQNVFKGVEGAVTHAFQGMEDALVEFVKTGKFNFRDFANSVISDIARIVIRAKVTGPLANFIMQSLGGGGGGGVGGGGFMDAGSVPITAAAKGGVFGSAGLSAYSSRIVSSPTLFAFARGAGLMGEAGPEAIMPLRRGPDGRLGVDAGGSSGGGGITIVNNTSAPIGKVTEQRTSNGDRVLVLEEVAAALHDPNSPISRAMGKNYNLGRRR